VNANGALIALSTTVAVGQTLVLMDPQNRDEREGRVARFGSLHARLDQVCLEFARPAPEFWQIGWPLGKCSGMGGRWMIGAKTFDISGRRNGYAHYRDLARKAHICGRFLTLALG
jgi:hypothetical protein